MQVESQLEEYSERKFYVQYVSNVPGGYWFRVHMLSGGIHDITIENTVSVEDSKIKVIEEFKQYIDGNVINYGF